MDALTVNNTGEDQTSNTSGGARRTYLHGPWQDFLLLGGASFLILPLLASLPEAKWRAGVAAIMLLVANFINHPHFAHSYQIFYRDYRRKITEGTLGNRYLFAGIAVPVLLVGFFAMGAISGNAVLIGQGVNIMGLLVGWHYVKQGYGMLMVDAALKRSFFDDGEKRILLWNGYAVWAAAWIQINDTLTQHMYWGLRYYSFDLPDWMTILAYGAVIGMGLKLVQMLWRRRVTGVGMPFNGMASYLVTLYLWVLFVHFDPLFALAVPALHSLQYLAVVYRFQTNFEDCRSVAMPAHERSGIMDVYRSSRLVRIVTFAAVGFILGGTLFWVAPTWLDARVDYDRSLFGANLFLIAFWVIVNVHHYFIDNVIWRRDNPETRDHLFRAG